MGLYFGSVGNVPAQGNVCQTIWAASSAGGCDSCNCSCCYISPTSSNRHHHLHNLHRDHNHDHNHHDHRNHQQHHHHKHQQTLVNTIFITKASKIELGSWQSCLNRFPRSRAGGDPSDSIFKSEEGLKVGFNAVSTSLKIVTTRQFWIRMPGRSNQSESESEWKLFHSNGAFICHHSISIEVTPMWSSSGLL